MLHQAKPGMNLKVEMWEYRVTGRAEPGSHESEYFIFKPGDQMSHSESKQQDLG